MATNERLGRQLDDLMSQMGETTASVSPRSVVDVDHGVAGDRKADRESIHFPAAGSSAVARLSPEKLTLERSPSRAVRATPATATGASHDSAFAPCRFCDPRVRRRGERPPRRGRAAAKKPSRMEDKVPPRSSLDLVHERRTGRKTLFPAGTEAATRVSRGRDGGGHHPTTSGWSDPAPCESAPRSWPAPAERTAACIR